MTEREAKQRNRSVGIWARLEDRHRWPRSWWYPLPSDRKYDPSTLPELHKECSATVRRVMLTLLGFALFCLLAALGANDASLVGAEAEIRIPFANVPISFLAFLVVAPLLLVILSIYLHIFVGYLRELEAAWRGYGNMIAPRVAALFNFDTVVPRLLTAFIFYWLTPLVLAAISWKAMAIPAFGVAMASLTQLVAFAMLFLHMRRSQDNRRWVRR
ncbi:MAG: hypothetical protein OEU49_14575, partial [Chromatiales bacterium]|nr:hypothetical protein [Chromatiales bacterium]